MDGRLPQTKRTSRGFGERSQRAPDDPLVDLAGSFTTSQTSSSDGRQGDAAGVGVASLNLSYLPLDFGGRKARAEDAYLGAVRR